jgi:hypothetical protein
LLTEKLPPLILYLTIFASLFFYNIVSNLTLNNTIIVFNEGGAMARKRQVLVKNGGVLLLALSVTCVLASLFSAAAAQEIQTPQGVQYELTLKEQYKDVSSPIPTPGLSIKKIIPGNHVEKTLEGITFKLIRASEGFVGYIGPVKITPCSKNQEILIDSRVIRYNLTITDTDAERIMVGLGNEVAVQRATLKWSFQDDFSDPTRRMQRVKSESRLASVQYNPEINYLVKLVQSFYDNLPTYEPAQEKDEFETTREFKERQKKTFLEYENTVKRYTQQIPPGTYEGIPIDIGKYDADAGVFHLKWESLGKVYSVKHRNIPYFEIESPIRECKPLVGESTEKRYPSGAVDYLEKVNISFDMPKSREEARLIRNQPERLTLALDYFLKLSTFPGSGGVESLTSPITVVIVIAGARLVRPNGQIFYEFK